MSELPHLPEKIVKDNNPPEKFDKVQFPQNMPWEHLPEEVYEAQCKLCNSKYRHEAEELYASCGNSRRVHKFLTEERMEEVSYNAVNNHMKLHFTAHNNERLLKDYASKVELWLGCQKDQYQSLQRAMAGLEREIMILAAMNEGLSLHERRKNNDIIVKMSSLLLNYRSKLRELEKEQEPVTLVFQQLQVILQDEMQQVDTEEVKGVVKNVLTRLKHSCQDLILGKN